MKRERARERADDFATRSTGLTTLSSEQLAGPDPRRKLDVDAILTGLDKYQPRRRGWIIGTGGALTRLPGGTDTLGRLLGDAARGSLVPGLGAEVLLDIAYIMATCGVMARDYPSAARAVLRHSLGL